MRIALVTIPGLYGAYFVRQIRAHFPGAEFLIFCQIPAAEPPRRPAEPALQRDVSESPALSPGSPPLWKRVVRKLYWKGYEMSKLRMNPISARAVWNADDVVKTPNINDAENVERITTFAPDYILIFGGRIVRPSLLTTAKKAALNVHGGKLPEYRGANGIKWMLWNGDIDRVCATVHIAAEKVDAGSILGEAIVPLLPGDSYRTVFTRLHVAGVRAMIAAVHALESGASNPRPQQGNARTYRASEWTPRHEAALDERLSSALRDHRLSSLDRRVVFHAYRRLHRIAPAFFDPKPGGRIVLLYHHVAPEAGEYVSRLGITIDPDHFEQHVRYLTTRFDVVPFSELGSGTAGPRAVALTFDDGYASIATTVLPILERYRCPIKVYICESLTDGGLLWLNKLSVVLNRLPAEELEKFLASALNRPAAAPRREPIVECIEYFDPARTLRILDEYFDRIELPPAPRLYLNESEIRRLLDHPLVEIGSHTRRHLPQHRLSAEARHDDIVAAHRDLVARFDERIRGFALPFGYRKHFTPEVVRDILHVDDAVVSAYGGYAEDALIAGHPEVRRIGVWGNVGTLWHQMARSG